ncbi:hypothetical protein FQN50_009206 [Emmonsiellopsis sp. PD_5]|nr:hypothetical protein FQN50_009206 [Emmonsiellopsis sp. PD_5]
MLVKGLRRILPAVGTLLVLVLCGLYFHSNILAGPPQTEHVPQKIDQNPHPIPPPSNPPVTTANDHDDDDAFGALDAHMASKYHQVYSVSTADRKYFPISFGDYEAMNPSILPHPSLENTWIIVAQQQKSSIEHSVWFAELVCNAVFKDGVLQCIKPPIILPIAATPSDSGKCTGDLEYFTFNIGPHDARVFYGPDVPYAVYGSNSQHTCFGQWMLDFRTLVDWGFEPFSPAEFRQATELQRPAPWATIEKNWFIFWDKHGQLYAHYDISPHRVFAKLDHSGSVISQNLAPAAASTDSKCMQKYLPQIPAAAAAGHLESIHQATNSLSITLCARSDPTCTPTDDNTFIMTIFQHKSYYAFHSVYEPYVMLFKQTAPFAIHAISSKPIWIHGRGKQGQGRKPEMLTPEAEKGWDQTEMVYVTSLSWRDRGRKYHGYSDDVLFVGFGIEDETTAGIDVLAGELVGELGLCSAVSQ